MLAHFCAESKGLYVHIKLVLYHYIKKAFAYCLLLCSKCSVNEWRLAMSALKRDLFAPIIKKAKYKRPLVRDIPSKATWKDEHGSWAIKMGIVKLDDETPLNK
jgi:hypothetical protein